MRVRVIQLVNNFYKDELQNESEIQNAGQELGEYCCFGYFDALEVGVLEFSPNTAKKGIKRYVNNLIMEKYDGTSNIKNIICVTKDDSKDEAFWTKAREYPFLFVSLVRINYKSDTKLEEIHETIRVLNRSENVIAYYTYDHSEVVVVKFGANYSEGVNYILSLYDQINIFKMYSVSAVREECLEDCKDIEDELINCKLHVTVKDMNKAIEFVEKLKHIIMMEENSEKVRITYSTMLGNGDMLIEIAMVSIRALLKNYKMGKLLTHSNRQYIDACFNINSQFLIGETEI